LLDAEHGAPEEKSDADDNSYFLGSIGGHNVVIACLPAGVAGCASAATVAAQMQRTFRNVRVGLLAGIGSSALSAADDIRLGDVVVSMPSGESGGVIEYACSDASIGGRDIGDSSVQFLRRPLNKPPTFLLTALSSLQAEHELRDNKICSLLAQAAQRYPKLRTKLTWPVQGGRAAADRLYQAKYQHEGTPGAGCGGCDVRMLVPWRENRPPSSDNSPNVHYGVIASGGKEFECGVARDQAKEALGVKCFEREAAGLMDNYPCLVIRGICDYADSHKSALWQGYAAGTAAAFTRELLENMPPRQVELAPTIAEAMEAGSSFYPTGAYVYVPY
jgi:nucleoside phosphorylase